MNKPPVRNPGPLNQDRYFRVLTDEKFMGRSFYNKILKVAFRWSDLKDYEYLTDYYAFFQDESENSFISLSLDSVEEVSGKSVDLDTLREWFEQYSFNVLDIGGVAVSNAQCMSMPDLLIVGSDNAFYNNRRARFCLKIVEARIYNQGIVTVLTPYGEEYSITFVKHVEFDPSKEQS